MSVLRKEKRYHVLKFAGDNEINNSEFIDIQNKTVSAFVVRYQGRISWNTREEAVFVAKTLATRTPGNRYIVVQNVAGYMMPESKLDSYEL